MFFIDFDPFLFFLIGFDCFEHDRGRCGWDRVWRALIRTNSYLLRFCQHERGQNLARSEVSKGHSCGTLLWDTLVGHSCRTLLWDTPVGHSCGTLLWHTLVGHSCRKLLWDTLVGHSCGTLLWDTLVGHS